MHTFLGAPADITMYKESERLELRKDKLSFELHCDHFPDAVNSNHLEGLQRTVDCAEEFRKQKLDPARHPYSFAPLFGLPVLREVLQILYNNDSISVSVQLNSNNQMTHLAIAFPWGEAGIDYATIASEPAPGITASSARAIIISQLLVGLLNALMHATRVWYDSPPRYVREGTDGELYLFIADRSAFSECRLTGQPERPESLSDLKATPLRRVSSEALRCYKTFLDALEERIKVRLLDFFRRCSQLTDEWFQSRCSFSVNRPFSFFQPIGMEQPNRPYKAQRFTGIYIPELWHIPLREWGEITKSYGKGQVAREDFLEKCEYVNPVEQILSHFDSLINSLPFWTPDDTGKAPAVAPPKNKQWKERPRDSLTLSLKELTFGLLNETPAIPNTWLHLSSHALKTDSSMDYDLSSDPSILNTLLSSKQMTLEIPSRLTEELGFSQLTATKTQPRFRDEPVWEIQVTDGKKQTPATCLSQGQRKILRILCYAHSGYNLLLENPEAFLHPSLQKELLAHMLELYKDDRRNFWIETHSTEMIEQIQRLLDTGKLAVERVNVLLAERSEGDIMGQARIRPLDEEPEERGVQ